MRAFFDVITREDGIAVSHALAERVHQDTRWGCPSVDDTRAEGEWASYILKYATASIIFNTSHRLSRCGHI